MKKVLVGVCTTQGKRESQNYLVNLSTKEGTISLSILDVEKNYNIYPGETISTVVSEIKNDIHISSILPLVKVVPNNIYLMSSFERSIKAMNCYAFSKNSKILIEELKKMVLEKFELNDENGNPRIAIETIIYQMLNAWSEEKKGYTNLSYLDFLTAKMWKNWFGWWYLNCNLRRFTLLGIAEKQVKIARKLHCLSDNTFLLSRIRSNPFSICSLELEQCRHISKIMGLPVNSERLEGWKMLNKLYQDFISRESYYYQTSDIPNFPIKDYDITNFEGKYQLQYVSDLEATICQMTEIQKNYQEIEPLDIEDLNSCQRQAYQEFISSSISIITGFPGTGKTYLISKIFEAHTDLKMALMAFTGKAVTRLKDLSKDRNKCCSTIHSFIARVSDFKKIEVIVIDEFSMVHYSLFARLVNCFSSMPKLKRIIIVGDPNQLPPIKWGSVFDQLLLSDLPITHLDKIVRSDNELARSFMIMIQQKYVKQLPGVNFMTFLPESKGKPLMPEGLREDTIEDPLIRCAIYSYLVAGGRQSLSAVILSPKRDTVNSINRYLQDYYVKEGKLSSFQRASYLNKTFYLGDRVINLKNLNSVKIYNGDEGEVIGFTSSAVVVKFGSKEVKFEERGDDDQPLMKYLDLAYALTVHKSQGSEWSVVIYCQNTPLRTSRGFFNRNLVYTAFTRAKEKVIVCGEKNKVMVALGTIARDGSACLFQKIKRQLE